MSGSICYRRSDPFTDEQDELSRPLSGACGYPEEGITPSTFISGTSSSCTSTYQHNAQHSFSDRFRQSMARPAPFSGSAEECNGFLLQCTLTIDLHPNMFPTDQSKIAFVITSLTGPALQWAETILNQAGPVTQTFSNFLAHFREVFSGSPGDSSVGEQLFQL